jgi:hypothetical protein
MHGHGTAHVQGEALQISSLTVIPQYRHIRLRHRHPLSHRQHVRTWPPHSNGLDRRSRRWRQSSDSGVWSGGSLWCMSPRPLSTRSYNMDFEGKANICLKRDCILITLACYRSSSSSAAAKYSGIDDRTPAARSHYDRTGMFGTTD